MAHFSKIKRLVIGVSAIGGAVLYFHSVQNKGSPVYASWTTNYTPPTSAKWDFNWDHRSPQFLLHPNKANKVNNGQEDDRKFKDNVESVTPKTTRHLILVRHGQYQMDVKSEKDMILTAKGRCQAEWTGNRLKELGLPYTSMVKSTMTRAQETGSIINSCLPKLPVKDCHLIREGAPIPPEPPVGHWKPETRQFYQDGARIEAGFREYFHRADASESKDTFTILVCHANVIRYFVCRALQFPPEAWLRFSLNHGSITWISITPTGRVVLRSLGDSGHIPPDLISS